MRTRGRLIFVSSILIVSTSFALAACVGDDPTSPSSPSGDASTSSDAVNGNDTTDIGVDSAPPPTTDASDAAVETFDGSNPTCNGLFPQDAPAPATIECDGSAPASVNGGTIGLGRYYLIDEKYPSAVCPTDLTGYSDVIEITGTGDGGLTVNAAANGNLHSRFTLAWAVNGATFNQYDICPNDGMHVSNVGYNANMNTLTYYLLGFGNLTYQKF